VHSKLKKSSKMSVTKLKALWCYLDVDDSNQVTADEMSVFLRINDGSRADVCKHCVGVRCYSFVFCLARDNLCGL